MIRALIDREHGRKLRIFNHCDTDIEHPGEIEIRLLGQDYFGNHIRSVECKAYVTERELGDALEALMLAKTGNPSSQSLD